MTVDPKGTVTVRYPKPMTEDRAAALRKVRAAIADAAAAYGLPPGDGRDFASAHGTRLADAILQFAEENYLLGNHVMPGAVLLFRGVIPLTGQAFTQAFPVGAVCGCEACEEGLTKGVQAACASAIAEKQLLAGVAVH